MSSTSTRWAASAENNTPVTPGRSGPVTVISTEDMNDLGSVVLCGSPSEGSRPWAGALRLRDPQMRARLGLGQRLPPPRGMGLAAHAVDHVRVVQLERRPLGSDPRQRQEVVPRIRSERPAFELHHPYMIDRMRSEAHPGRGWKPLAEAEASSHPEIPKS